MQSKLVNNKWLCFKLWKSNILAIVLTKINEDQMFCFLNYHLYVWFYLYLLKFDFIIAILSLFQFYYDNIIFISISTICYLYLKVNDSWNYFALIKFFTFSKIWLLKLFKFILPKYYCILLQAETVGPMFSNHDLFINILLCGHAVNY